MTTTALLSCSVRGCGLPLERVERAYRCARGHSFDLSRRGVLNLLQPQDRRSRVPGDGRDVVAARERLAELGLDRVLIAGVVTWFRALDLPQEPGLLEVGAGVGTQLGALLAARAADAYGLDLSGAAAAVAARRHPGPLWIVANAERRLPFLDASLDVVVAVKGPKNPPELARVLAPGGRLLLVVPAPDDLVELRGATAAGGLPRDPAARALERFEPHFTLRSRAEARERRVLAGEALRDLLHVSYRGRRASEAGRAAGLERLEVTLAAVLLDLERPAYSGGSS